MVKADKEILCGACEGDIEKGLIEELAVLEHGAFIGDALLCETEEKDDLMPLALISVDAEQARLVFCIAPLDAVPVTIVLCGEMDDGIAMTSCGPKDFEACAQVFKNRLVIALAHEEADIRGLDGEIMA